MNVIQPHLLFSLKQIVDTALVDSKYVLQALYYTVKYKGNKLKWLDPDFYLSNKKKTVVLWNLIVNSKNSV